MGVPGHDERDFTFAEAFNLPCKKVIQEPNTELFSTLKSAYTEQGIVLNSGKYDGMHSLEMKTKITNDLESNGKGKKKVILDLETG